MRALIFLWILGGFFFQGLPVYAQPPSFDDELIFYLAANECEGERKNWRSCKKTIQTSDDTIYVGNFLQGQPHGWGVTKNIETNSSVEGLWYRGDLIYGQMESSKLHTKMGFSTRGAKLGFSKIKRFTKSGLIVGYSHIHENKSYGNTVTEVLDQNGSWDSSFIGPSDGTKPFGLGFFFIRGLGVKWCSLNTNDKPCNNESWYNTAIGSIKQSFNELSPSQRKDVQGSLKKLGYYKSSVDGAWGQNTQQAILKFLALHTELSLSPSTKISHEDLWLLFDPKSFKRYEYGSIDRLINYGFEPTSETFGTGFVFNPAGFILTNEHVVRGCSNIKFFLNGMSAEAKIVSSDQQLDLAVLATSLKGNDILTFDSENFEPSIMDKIFTVGFPYGGEVSSDITVTSGIISSESVGSNGIKKFQIDAAIQPGNSGGPVINERGHLLGIATSKADTNYFLEKFGSIPENIAFAIDLSTIILFLEKHGFDAIESVSSNVMPNLKNIVGRISCTAKEFVDINEIAKARFIVLAE